MHLFIENELYNKLMLSGISAIDSDTPASTTAAVPKANIPNAFKANDKANMPSEKNAVCHTRSKQTGKTYNIIYKIDE